MCEDRGDRSPGSIIEEKSETRSLKPVQDKSVDEVDTLMADELAQLSIMDREKVYSDIHGISNETQESHEFVERHLGLLETKLDNMLASTPDESRAYRLALSKDPSYARDNRLRLRFLRADRFDVGQAAQRFLRHFAMKLDLFGDDLLVKDISQEQLDGLDIDALHNEIGFMMPMKDMGGRTLVVKHSPSTSSVDIPIRPILRAAFYAGMVETENEESQRQGLVVVAYYIGDNFQWTQIASRQGIAKHWGSVFSALPLRIEALHLCSDTLVWRPLFAVFKLGISVFTRMRVREHFGTHDTVCSSLQTFGIPLQNFPKSEDGRAAMKAITIERWKKRRTQESSRGLSPEPELSSSSALATTTLPAVEEKPLASETDGIAVAMKPGRNDVLLGRGKAYYYHTGNRHLRDLVLERYSRFEEAKYSEKKKLCDEVLQLIHSKQGRFLKEGNRKGDWTEVENEAAQRKISHIFRGLRGTGSSSNDEEDKLLDEHGSLQSASSAAARRRSRAKKRPSTELVISSDIFVGEQPGTDLCNTPQKEQRHQREQASSPEDFFKRRRSVNAGEESRKKTSS